MNLYTLTQKHHPWAVSLRRHFHQYPEVSGEEYQTQAKLLAELKALQINCRPAGTTGVIAEIHGKNSGKTIAIRADIDALPIQDECNTPYPVSYTHLDVYKRQAIPTKITFIWPFHSLMNI